VLVRRFLAGFGGGVLVDDDLFDLGGVYLLRTNAASKVKRGIK
jgi:hypothetical protein